MAVRPHAAIEEMIPAYALGALERNEQAEIQQHMLVCAACRDELASFEAVMDVLPLAVPEAAPSPVLRARLLAGLAQEPLPARPLSLTDFLRGLFSAPRWQPVLTVVALLLLAGGLWGWQRAQNAGISPPQITLAPTDNAPEASGLILVSQNLYQATLIVEGLPPLSPDQQYQLWLVKDGERDNGGVFSVNPDGSYRLAISAPLPMSDYSNFGITIEPAGGSPGPTGNGVLRSSRS